MRTRRVHPGCAVCPPRCVLPCVAASVKIVYEPQPTPQQIAGLAGAVITRVRLNPRRLLPVVGPVRPIRVDSPLRRS